MSKLEKIHENTQEYMNHARTNMRRKRCMRMHATNVKYMKMQKKTCRNKARKDIGKMKSYEKTIQNLEKHKNTIKW